MLRESLFNKSNVDDIAKIYDRAENRLVKVTLKKIHINATYTF